MMERIQGNKSPVLDMMDGHWVKIVGVLIHHFGLTEIEITEEMVKKFSMGYPGDIPAVLADTRGGKFIIRLMSMKDAEEEVAKDGKAASQG